MVLLATLRTLGDAPTRSVQALAQRLGVAEAHMAVVVVPPAPDTPLVAPALEPTSPLLVIIGPKDASSAPRIRLGKRAVIAARKSTIR